MPGFFAQTAPELLAILEELSAQEPIFHRPAFARTPQDFGRLMAPGYWEVGASGRRYDRDFILEMYTHTQAADAADGGLETSDFACQELTPDTYLLTYRLEQPNRPTRRTTIWKRTAEGWRILFHQGTVITAEADNTAP